MRVCPIGHQRRDSLLDSSSPTLGIGFKIGVVTLAGEFQILLVYREIDAGRELSHSAVVNWIPNLPIGDQ